MRGGGVDWSTLGRLGVLCMAAALSALLASCYSHVDEIRMRIDKEEKGVVIALVSADLQDPDIDTDELKNDQAYQELEYLQTKVIAPCTISHRLYRRRGKAFLDLRGRFEDADELNSILNCGAQHIEEPSVEFERHDGFFHNRYVTRFSITQMTEACGTPEECDDQPVLFPRVLTLTIPGKVDRIESSGSPLGFDIQTRELDDNSAQVRIREQPNRGALLSRHFRGSTEPRRDTLTVEIRSFESNYNLNTIISVVGVIFGSGVLIQLSKLLFSRLRKGSDGPERQPRRPRKPYSSL